MSVVGETSRREFSGRDQPAVRAGVVRHGHRAGPAGLREIEHIFAGVPTRQTKLAAAGNAGQSQSRNSRLAAIGIPATASEPLPVASSGVASLPTRCRSFNRRFGGAPFRFGQGWEKGAVRLSNSLWPDVLSDVCLQKFGDRIVTFVDVQLEPGPGLPRRATLIPAASRPRWSPPAQSPATRAAINRSARLPLVCS
ncbi:MAG: hypothetical protein Ct9H300mP1_18540 [Planctomycetaceae bacterium]|nr:MAG: hypothetical protein Ct9H300mP1_18540 [Planctomycetaceae bacterium]